MIQRYEREAKREETVLDKLKKTRPKSSIVQIIQKCENQREWVFHFQQADVNWEKYDEPGNLFLCKKSQRLYT